MTSAIEYDQDEYRQLIAAEEKKIKHRKRTQDWTKEGWANWKALGNRWRGAMPKANLTSYATHKHSFWAERANNPDAPGWFRVAAFAYGSDRANGHVNLAPGELQMWLGESGEAGKRATSRAIKTAVEYGLLGDGSGTRCLIIPGREQIVKANSYVDAPIWGGTDGNPFGRCEICHV
jgi:hypothetical protein